MAYFFYDAHCSLCARFSGYLRALAPGVECVAGAAGSADQPEAVRKNISEHAVYLGEDGGLAFGHRAIGSALASHGHRPVIRWAGRVLCSCALDPLWRSVYELVARNRHRIGAVVGLPACGSPEAGDHSFYALGMRKPRGL